MLDAANSQSAAGQQCRHQSDHGNARCNSNECVHKQDVYTGLFFFLGPYQNGTSPKFWQPGMSIFFRKEGEGPSDGPHEEAEEVLRLRGLGTAALGSGAAATSPASVVRIHVQRHRGVRGGAHDVG